MDETERALDGLRSICQYCETISHRMHNFGTKDVLPLVVLKRFDSVLADTKAAVLEMDGSLPADMVPDLVERAASRPLKREGALMDGWNKGAPQCSWSTAWYFIQAESDGASSNG